MIKEFFETVKRLIANFRDFQTNSIQIIQASHFVNTFQNWRIVKIIFNAGKPAEKNGLSFPLLFPLNEQVSSPNCALLELKSKEVFGILSWSLR